METEEKKPSMKKQKTFKKKGFGRMKTVHSVDRAAGSTAHQEERSSDVCMNSATAVYHRNVFLADDKRGSIGPKRLGDEFTAAFMEQVEQQVEAEDYSFQARLRVWLAHIMLNQRFETSIGILILSNFVVIALETEVRARHESAAEGSSERATTESLLRWITITHLVYLLAYTMECSIRLFVFRCEFFNSKWNMFDFLIVVVGVVSEVFSFVQLQSDGVNGLDRLRIIRTIRLLRATRVLVSFDELYTLVSGLTHAMKALMWASLLMLMGLTVWSIIAVEYLKPLMPQISQNNGFGSCSWCPSAFDNLVLSNLTFFQIISGDGWSAVGRPLIEEHAWTALVFVGVIFSMIFGLLNLVVAVIVDSAVQAREADIMTTAARKDAARAAAWDCFNDMVGEIDADGDGVITVEELRHGLTGGDELGSLGAYLTTMGIEMSDLDMVFELLDQDGDGTVSHEEFTDQLYQMKTQELPITLCYVRSGVNNLHRELENIAFELHDKLDKMFSSVKQVAANNQAVPETFLGVVENLMNNQGEKSGARAQIKRKTSIFEGDHKRGSFFFGKTGGKQAPTLRMAKAADKARASMQSVQSLRPSTQPVQPVPPSIQSLQTLQTVTVPATNVGPTAGASNEGVSGKMFSMLVANSNAATTSEEEQSMNNLSPMSMGNGGASCKNISNLHQFSFNEADEEEADLLEVPATESGKSNTSVTSKEGASGKNLSILPEFSLNEVKKHVMPATTVANSNAAVTGKVGAWDNNVSSFHGCNSHEEGGHEVEELATKDGNLSTEMMGNEGASGKNVSSLDGFSLNEKEELAELEEPATKVGKPKTAEKGKGTTSNLSSSNLPGQLE